MAMGKRRRHAKQASMWGATHNLPRSAAHPFYTRLNQILDEHDFRWKCEQNGKPGAPLGGLLDKGTPCDD
jgi:hypothetical protein